MERVTHLLKKMTRLKTITDSFHHTELRRCLTTFDLTLLGIGHMVGSGIYVLSGTIVNTKAGPSAILSYLFAGVAALLSALCYAEFGARIPKAGSAYSYTYVTIGEIWGFLVGWNLLLEYVLGTAAVGRSWSGTVDSLFDGAIRNGTLKYVGYLSHDSEWVSEYPDFLAAGIIMVMFLVVSAGAKQSLILNSLFTILNMFVILFILCFGFSHADVAYWTDSQFGGFFPFGVSGTLSAAASCFFAYIGFEGIGVAGEEAHNPAKSIPLATLVAILVVTVTYMSATSALTLMVPYYDVSLTAAFPAALERVGATWERYLVTVGTLIGISCSMLGGAFGMPRTVYAMANDGLLLRCLGNVNPFTHTPILSTLLFGTLTAILALFISMETLVEFLSVGTLFVYSVVAANLIILRYSPDERFKMPLVPYLPLLSILINLMLMMSLSAITWLRLLVWVALEASHLFVATMTTMTTRANLHLRPSSDAQPVEVCQLFVATMTTMTTRANLHLRPSSDAQPVETSSASVIGRPTRRGLSPVRYDDDDDDNASQTSSASVIGRPTRRGLSPVRGDGDDDDNASQSLSASVIGRPTRRCLPPVRYDDDNASQTSSASVIGRPTRRGLSLVRYDDDNDDNASQTSSASVIGRPTRRGLSPVRGDGDDDDNASQSSSASVIGRPTRRGLSLVRYDDDDASQSSSDDRARIKRMIRSYWSLSSFVVVCVLVVFAGAFPAKVNEQEKDPAYWVRIGQEELSRALKQQPINKRAKNIILLVGDGMGVTTVNAARIYQGQMANKTGEEGLLSFERFPYMAHAKTYNIDKQTPDSAGTATAFLCGVKSNFGTIGVDATVTRGNCSAQAGHEVTSILHWSQDTGKHVGVVTNTRITHATPSPAYAHSADRGWESDADMTRVEGRENCKDIARQLVEDNSDIRVILGGGRYNFLPHTMPDPESGEMNVNRRLDGRNLVKEWLDDKERRNRWAHYVWNATALTDVDLAHTDYLLGLFESGHMDYEYARTFEPDPLHSEAGEPSLAEMTTAAIQILQKAEEGYFLFVEGGKIDHAHHSNLAKLSLIETVAFDEAVRAAVEMTSQEETLILVTADHSHVLVIGGYPSRGNSITGEEDVNLAQDDLPYTTLLYGNGPGYQHPNGSREDITYIHVGQ
ncbi:hypothetical protein ACOMHN_019785 [Nucella lapillus]